MEYAIAIAVQAIFTLAHVVSKWQDHRTNLERIGLWTYIKEEAPAKTLLSVLTSAGLAFVMVEMQSYNAITALTAGWSSNSMMDHLTKRGQQMLGDG